MKITQLSIFLENKVGVINEVTAILSDNNINMRAFSVAEGMEFGILRLIVPESNIEQAQSLLQESGFKVSITDVICINLPNIAGSLNKLLNCLAREEVFIKYMYSFSEGDVSSTVIRPTNVDRCSEVLKNCSEELKSYSPLYSF